MSATSFGPHFVAFARPRPEIEHPDRHRLVANQLKQVAVAAHDDDGVLALAAGQRAEHVVGLAVRRARGRNAERVQDLHDHVDLGRQVVGHLFDVGLARRLLLGDTVRLVGGDEVHPPLRPPVVVAAHHQPGRPFAGDDGGDGVEEAAQGVDGPAVGRGDRGGHPEEGAEPHAGAVEQ